MDYWKMSSFMSGCSARTLISRSKCGAADANEAAAGADCIGPTFRERFAG